MSKAAELAALIGSQSSLSNRNLVINGAMQVAQRGTVSGVTSGYGGPDRYQFVRAGACSVDMSQSTDVPSAKGFVSSIKLDVNSADSSLAAGDYAFLNQKIEAQNLQHLKKGTSNSSSLTASFWIKSSTTGTYIFELYDFDNSRHIGKSYTISTADTWEYKVITFAGDTSGVLNNDSGTGLQLGWWLAAGSTYSGGTLQTDWGADSAADRAVGQVNAVDDAANNIFITGVQLELGEQDTPFEHRSFGDELIRCGRYYQKWNDVNWIMGVEGTRNTKMPFQFSTLMRANATCAISGGTATNGALAGTGVTDPKKEMVNLHFWRGVSGGLTNATFSGYTLTADAEL